MNSSVDARAGGARLRLLVTTAAVGAIALAGCSGGAKDQTGGASGGGAQQITFLTHWGPEQVTQLEAAAKAFSAKNPNVTVKIQAVPFGNLLSTLRTQGASPNGPTIVSIYDLWLPELVRDGLAVPAPEDVSADVTKNWPANLVQDVTKDAKVYGYPNEVDLYQLNYNKRLFAAAGLNKPPATWDELLASAKKLTKTDNGKITQQGFGLITNWAAGSVHPFLSFAASNDGGLLRDGKSALTGQHTKAVAELYQKLVAEKVTDPAMSAANANTTGPYLDNFVNGRTAMIVMANWWQGSLKKAMGNAYTDIATAPIPVGPNGKGASAISYAWLTMVNAKADPGKQSAAWKFLTFLNGPESGKDGSSMMGDVLMQLGTLPSRTSDITAHGKVLADPFLKTYVDSLPNATPFPTVIGGQAATEALQKQLENLVFGKTNAADAMSTASRDVDAALAKGAKG